MPSHQKHRGQPKGGKSSAPPVDEQPSQAYDGPNDSPSRGRARSSAGARPPSRGQSQTRTSSQNRKVDPARDPARDRPAAPVLSRNVDFGGQAYSMFSSVSRSFISYNCPLLLASHQSALPCSPESHKLAKTPRPSDR